jgi:hypothetical protein
MLPEFANVGAAETSVCPLLGWRGGSKVGEVGFDVGFDGRSGALEVAQALHFVGDELIVRRALHGQEVLEESDDLGRPCITPVATTGRWLIA